MTTTDTASTRLAAAALRYAALGWPVMPLHTPTDGGCSCENPACQSPGKHPRTRRGIDDATTMARRVTGWWQRWPDANVGIVTGTTLAVLDIDGHPGRVALAELEATHGPLSATLTASTGHGEHRYFALPHALDLGNSVGRLGDALDVRARRGYVVAPPSRHSTGHRYAWTQHEPPAPLPAWIVAELMPPRRHVAPPPVRRDGRGDRYLEVALQGELRDVAAAPAGARNDTLNRAAFRLGQLLATGRGETNDIVEDLHAAALAVGLGEQEAHATIHSGLNAGLRYPREPTPHQ